MALLQPPIQRRISITPFCDKVELSTGVCSKLILLMLDIVSHNIRLNIDTLITSVN